MNNGIASYRVFVIDGMNVFAASEADAKRIVRGEPRDSAPTTQRSVYSR